MSVGLFVGCLLLTLITQKKNYEKEQLFIVDQRGWSMFLGHSVSGKEVEWSGQQVYNS